ncbi:hypothetical protein, partial [Bartonella bovis]|uniref:hypothetical protein n=1 Tax=Bartonella bovis TaxID=155194 RepID=UPI0019586629
VDKGVLMKGGGTLTMTGVQISGVKMGVEATAGNLTINGHSTIMFNNGRDNYGVKVGSGVTLATLTDVTIAGSGQGMGVYGEGAKAVTLTNVGISGVDKGVLMKGGGTLTMTKVNISGVKMGVEAMGGNLTISGNSVITFKNGNGNYGVRVGSGVTNATLTNVRIAGGGQGGCLWRVRRH